MSISELRSRKTKRARMKEEAENQAKSFSDAMSVTGGGSGAAEHD